MRRDDVYNGFLWNPAPVFRNCNGSRMRILFKKIIWNASAVGIDWLCRWGYGGGIYLEFADSDYGTDGGYGQR